MPRKPAISKEDRKLILDTWLAGRFETAIAMARALGLSERYSNTLANERGYHIKDIVGRPSRAESE